MASSANLTLEQIKTDLRAWNPRVLVVDDTPTMQKMTSNQLRLAGITNIETVGDGDLAVAKLQSDPSFDLVLMDNRMPRMNGDDATRELRKKRTSKDLPIIGISGDDVEVGCLNAGMNAFCKKPAQNFELLPIIHRLLQEKDCERFKSLHTL
jgi:CheY-like chemotaxis protein